MKHCGVFLVWALMLIFAVGCGDSTTGIVTGTVTVDGEPVSGAITFAAVDGKTGPAGGPIVDGLYTATVPVGMSKVAIRVAKVIGTQKLYDTPDSKIHELTDEMLPPKYNDESELTYEIPSGKSTKNFDIELPKRKKRR